jgi:hypothetical protein
LVVYINALSYFQESYRSFRQPFRRSTSAIQQEHMNVVKQAIMRLDMTFSDRLFGEAALLCRFLLKGNSRQLNTAHLCEEIKTFTFLSYLTE